MAVLRLKPAVDSGSPAEQAFVTYGIMQRIKMAYVMMRVFRDCSCSPTRALLFAVWQRGKSSV